jgi:predicted dehydrogenase
VSLGTLQKVRAMGNDLPKRAVLIGAGMVAQTHVAACADARQVIIHGIQSRNPDRARDLADRAEALIGERVQVYDSIDTVAADPVVDFVIVLTPPDARAAIVRPLAAAGKHVLLEKPMGRNGTEAREVVRLCREAGVTLGVVFQHRVRAASRKAAQMVANGDLGALGLVEIAVPWWREQAIHTIDLALSLTGPVKAVRAMAATTCFHDMEAEDFVTAGLEFANGAVGSLVASTSSFPGGAESITLHFDAASLRLQSGQLHVYWRDGQSEAFGVAGGTGGGAEPMAFTHAWHQNVIEDFADALIEGRTPAITGEDALAAHDLIDAITTSARTGGPTELTI